MKNKKALLFAGILLFVSSVCLAQPAVGDQAPDIMLPDTKGNTRKLSDHAGKVVLVDFWASWCGPCRKSNPDLVRLYAKYRKKGFEIFGISIDENSVAWKKAILMDRMTWTQVNEEKGWEGPVASAWKIEQIPTSYLLDTSGKIIAVDPDKKFLEETIIQLTNKEL